MANQTEPTAAKIITIDTTVKAGGYLDFGLGEKIKYSTYIDFVDQYSRIDKDQELVIRLTSHGGDALYSMMIARMILNHPGKTRVEIPLIAMSGATVIALAADELAMTPNACLGAIDVQMSLAIKSIIPTVRKYREKSIICGVIYDICDSYQRDYIGQLKELFKKRYPEKFNDVIRFFYYKHQHQIPIFATNLPDYMNVQPLELQRSPEPAPVPNTSNNPLSSLMGNMGMPDVFGGGRAQNGGFPPENDDNISEISLSPTDKS